MSEGYDVRIGKPYVLCVDVGGPTKIGWADSEGQDGTGANLGEALDGLATLLLTGRWVALGFEAPIWTPVRVELARITGRRGGLERRHTTVRGRLALAPEHLELPWH